MNVAFWLLVVLALIVLWFLCSFLYKAIGGLFLCIFGDAVDIMSEENDE